METLSELQKDIIDSRDLIKAMEDWQEIIDDDASTQEEKEEAQENLKELKEFCEPFEGYGELISENYWVEYVKDMLIDCGYITRDFPSWIEIDWEATADNVSQDYIFENGYYMRA